MWTASQFSVWVTSNLSVLQESTSAFVWCSWCWACWSLWCWHGWPKMASISAAAPKCPPRKRQETRKTKRMKVRKTWLLNSYVLSLYSNTCRYRAEFLIAASIPTEAKPDISVVQLNGPEEDRQMLRKVVKFLEAFDTKEQESDKNQKLADTMDKIFFWIYFISATLYFCAMIYVMVRRTCSVNHFDFWY